jgi:hypothetical protein
VSLGLGRLPEKGSERRIGLSGMQLVQGRGSSKDCVGVEEPILEELREVRPQRVEQGRGDVTQGLRPARAHGQNRWSTL